jgi:hypothetical protein
LSENDDVRMHGLSVLYYALWCPWAWFLYPSALC